MFLRVALGIVMLAHGFVHVVLALIPNPNDAEPIFANFFSGYAGDWLQKAVPIGALRVLAAVLSIVAGIGFLMTGLALFSKLVPHDWWRALAIASSMPSLIVSLLFWDRHLRVGPVVALGLIVALAVFRWPTEALLGY